MRSELVPQLRGSLRRDDRHEARAVDLQQHATVDRHRSVHGWRASDNSRDGTRCLGPANADTDARGTRVLEPHFRAQNEHAEPFVDRLQQWRRQNQFKCLAIAPSQQKVREHAALGGAPCRVLARAVIQRGYIAGELPLQEGFGVGTGDAQRGERREVADNGSLAGSRELACGIAEA